jgi:hypothetical protein
LQVLRVENLRQYLLDFRQNFLSVQFPSP